MADPSSPKKPAERGGLDASRIAVALYDGKCRICTKQAESLRRLSRNTVAVRSFHEPGALESSPDVRFEDCITELKLIAPGGNVYGGAEAIVRVLKLSRPIVGRLVMLYYLPGVRQATDALYRWIARNRYRLFGRVDEEVAGACDRHAAH